MDTRYQQKLHSTQLTLLALQESQSRTEKAHQLFIEDLNKELIEIDKELKTNEEKMNVARVMQHEGATTIVKLDNQHVTRVDIYIERCRSNEEYLIARKNVLTKQLLKTQVQQKAESTQYKNLITTVQNEEKEHLEILELQQLQQEAEKQIVSLEEEGDNYVVDFAELNLNTFDSKDFEDIENIEVIDDTEKKDNKSTLSKQNNINT